MVFQLSTLLFVKMPLPVFFTFAPESMKSSHLLMDSPTEFWKPRRYRYDAEVMTSRMQYQTRLNIAETKIKLDESQVTLLTSKTFQVMQQHIYYNRYSMRFVDMRIPELVTVFNAQVKSRE